MRLEQDESHFTSDEVRARYEKVESNGDIVKPIVEALDARVFGQHDACAAVARRVAISQSPFVDPQHPLASIFMMGPTGTGKTEMSRALAEHLFKKTWEDRLLVIDCTQFADEADISRFIGSSPQYVGYGDKGIITQKFLAQKPNIIVFDEVEKAHYAIWELLLRVLDKGKMMARVGTDVMYHATEEELLFNDSYIFFTSNVGAAQIGEIQQLLASGSIEGETGSERIKLAANDALKKLFKPMPEFLGRLDDIVVFQPLGDKQYRRIFDKVMGEINQQLEDKLGTPQLSYTHEFRDYVLSLVNKEYGAREIRRWIDREFIEHAVDITGSKDLGNIMLIADYNHDTKEFRIKPLELRKKTFQQPRREEKPSATSFSEKKSGKKEGSTIERARTILGSDFLGEDAIKTMEQKLEALGVKVEFNIDKLPPLTYTERDLEYAQGREMLVLRPDTMFRNGKEVPITLRGLQKLFRKDPFGGSKPLIVIDQDADGESFTRAGEIQLQWALVQKIGDFLNWWPFQGYKKGIDNYYTKLTFKSENDSINHRLRTATECVWDTLLYYVNTGEHLLKGSINWTKTNASNGFPVVVDFNSYNLRLSAINPDKKYYGIHLLKSCEFR